MTSEGSPPRVTIVDVARQAAVSRQTVSNALPHPERVHPDTLERVMAAIDGLGYQPSSAAQSLRSQRAGALGVEVNTLGARLPQRDDGAVPRLAGHAGRAARHARRAFGSPENSPMLDGYRQMWARRLVDAFVIADTHHGDPRPPWLAATASRSRPSGGCGTTRPSPGLGRRRRRRGTGPPSPTAAGRLRPVGLPRAGRTARSSATTGGAAGSRRLRGTPAPTRRARQATAAQDLDARSATPRGRCCARSGPATRSSARPTSSRSACTTSCSPPACEPGLDVGVVGFDGSETARMHHLPSVAQPLDAIAEHTFSSLLDDAMAGPSAPSGGGAARAGPDPGEEHRPPHASADLRPPPTPRPRPGPTGLHRASTTAHD